MLRQLIYIFALDALPKLTQLLEDLAQKFSTMKASEMDFEKHGTEYNRTTVKGQLNTHRVDCMKNVLEALMEYVLTTGADKEMSRANLVFGLFEAHRELNELLKVRRIRISIVIFIILT